MRQLSKGRQFRSRRLRAVILLTMFVVIACAANRPPREITVVEPITTFAWPTYIAKEGGYYEKYGLKVRLVFANHPADIATLVSDEAQVALTTLEQAMQLSPKYSSIVVIGSPLRKWLFALIAGKDIRSVHDLKGKRVGVTQIGGSTYNYAQQLLSIHGISGKEVQWINLGSSSRPSALASGRIDATMLSAPSYFALADAGFNAVANISDEESIFATNALIFKRETVEKDPELPELLIKAHADAVKRFYEDEAFAIQAHLVYDKQDVTGLKRVYQTYVKSEAFDRVPYVPADAVRYVVENAAEEDIARMKAFDYHTVIQNNIVDQLVQKGFFEQLFGSEIRSEQERKALQQFR